MRFISLLVCIALSVTTVQPISSATDDTNSHAVVKKSQDISKIGVISEGYSDSFIQKKSNATKSGSSSPMDPPKTAVEKPKSLRRGHTDTGTPPSSDDSRSTNAKNSSPLTKNVDSAPKIIHLDPKVSKNVLDKLSNGSGSVTKAANATSSATVAKATISSTTSTSTTTTTTTTTSTSTTTTTTTTTPKPTTTTTTPPPKKPLITFAVDDVPGLMSKAVESHPPVKDLPTEEIGNNEPISLQSSETITYPSYRTNHNVLMAMIGAIVVIPLIIVVTNCAIRKVRDVWSKRRYRRMDYLIEDMYN